MTLIDFSKVVVGDMVVSKKPPWGNGRTGKVLQKVGDKVLIQYSDGSIYWKSYRTISRKET